MKRILAAFFCLAALAHANVYTVTQTGPAPLPAGHTLPAGGPVALSVAGFNALKTLAPGDTAHFQGVITSQVFIPASGTAALPIYLFLDAGCIFSSPAWPYPGAINGYTKNYVIIDGQNVGIIENTANGSGLANQVNDSGVWLANATGCTVQNLSVVNLYVRTVATDPNGFGKGVTFVNNGGPTGYGSDTVTHCIFHDEFAGVQITYATGCHDFIMSYCTAFNCNWDGNAGDYNNVASLTNLSVHDNRFSSWTCWDSPTDSAHHDGFFCWSNQGGASFATNIDYYNNVIGPGFSQPGQVSNATSGLFIQGAVSNYTDHNNTFIHGLSGDYCDDGDDFINPSVNMTSTYTVTGDVFIGGGKGAAIGLSIGGLPKGVTAPSGVQNVTETGNICVNMATAIQVFENGTIKLVADGNLAVGLGSQGYCWSPSDVGKFLSFAQWQALGFDLHPL